MNPIPRIIAACVAGMAAGAANAGGSANMEAVPWLVGATALFAWLGWRR